MQQYNTEHQRAEALQQKVKKLEQSADSKDDILKQLQQLSNAVSKINMAIQMLQNLQPVHSAIAARDFTRNLHPRNCTAQSNAHLQDLLTADNIKLCVNSI